jgi:hypothetical protein
MLNDKDFAFSFYSSDGTKGPFERTYETSETVIDVYRDDSCEGDFGSCVVSMVSLI